MMKLEAFFSKIEALFNGECARQSARADKAEADLQAEQAKVASLTTDRDAEKTRADAAEAKITAAEQAKTAAEQAKAAAEQERDALKAKTPEIAGRLAAKVVAGATGEPPLAAGDVLAPESNPVAGKSEDIEAQWESIHKGGSVAAKSKFFRENKDKLLARMNEQAAKNRRENN